MLQPIFREELVERLAARACANADRLLDGWNDGAEVDVASALMELSQRNILETLFGSASQGTLALLIAANRARRRFVEDVYFSLFPLPEYLPTPTNVAYARTMRRVDPVIYGAIAERRRSSDRPDDLLTSLLEATDKDGRTMSDTYFFACFCRSSRRASTRSRMSCIFLRAALPRSMFSLNRSRSSGVRSLIVPPAWSGCLPASSRSPSEL